MSLLPPKHIELGSSDKFSHFLAYFVLILTYGYWRHKKYHAILGIVAFICYGVLLELLQGLVPGRVPSFLDCIANSLGVLIGSTILQLRKKLSL
jgi:VanZ family protein